MKKKKIVWSKPHHHVLRLSTEENIYGVETTCGINSLISKLITFVETG
jgi:hypothetical protein